MSKTIQQFKEEREKEFEETDYARNGLMDVGFIISFHNESIETLLDLIAEWAEARFRECPDCANGEIHSIDELNTTLFDLLTFINRNK